MKIFDYLADGLGFLEAICKASNATTKTVLKNAFSNLESTEGVSLLRKEIFHGCALMEAFSAEFFCTSIKTNSRTSGRGSLPGEDPKSVSAITRSKSIREAKATEGSSFEPDACKSFWKDSKMALVLSGAAAAREPGFSDFITPASRIFGLE